MRSIAIVFTFVLLLVARVACAVQYYEDDRSMGSDVPGLPHYHSPGEACIKGVLIRKVQAYEEGDNRQYRYRGANVGPDDGFAEFACQGVIERQFYYPGAIWVTVETVATNVYGPFGSSDPCSISGYEDGNGQCGPPKCNDGCCSPGGCTSNGSEPIHTASGNEHETETDFSGTGPFPLRFTRTYDSNRVWLASSLPIGIGWTHSYVGLITVFPQPGSSTLTQALVYRPDGRILTFNLSGSVWTPDSDVPERLSVTEDGSGNYVSATFTTKDDDVETYDQLGRLTSITNRGGFVQTLAYTTGPLNSTNTISHNFVQTVTDPQGHALTFGYNSTTGLLTSLTDGNGAVIQYTYDSNSNLQTVVYPDLNSTTKTRTFYYNGAGPYGAGTTQTGGVSQPNALTGIQDENGQPFLSWGYDAQGRANLSVHGSYTGGTIDRTAFAFNSDGTTTVTDGLGQARKFTFQVQYLVARYTVLDTACDYCGTNFTSRGYDTNGYPSTGTDFRGYQTTSQYTETDSNGHSRGLETQLDEAVGQPEERITNTTWDANFRVPDSRTVTNHGGMVETRTDWAYNTRGQPIAHCEYPDPTSTYACSASTAPPSNSGIRRWVFTYCDAINLAAPDPIGSGGENLGKGCPLVGLLRRVAGPRSDVNDWTTYQYYLANGSGTPPAYLAGDQAETIDALGHITQYLSYDGNGRITQRQDINSVTTSFTYHPRGWLHIQTVCANPTCSASPNDATTQTDYDGVGNATKITQPDGAYLSYTFDNAHRLTNITDNLGNHVDYTLDALGHHIAEKTFDVSDAVTPRQLLTRSYNTLSRMTDAYDAQVRDTHFSYDGNGNRTDQTDPLGVKTHWDFDGLNRLKDEIGDYQGTDPSTANSETIYAHDTRDNITQITDPNNMPTGYTFDGLNNLTLLQSPDTGTSHYPSYDPAGNRLTKTDNRGVTWTMAYDAMYRMTSIAYPTTNLNVAYSYDSYSGTPCAASSYPVGRLTGMADASGSTTYCFDLRGNIIEKIQATHGYRFDTRYSYNLADRLMSITYPSGAVVNYTRDADGRIQTVSVTPPGGSATAVITNLTWQPFGPPITYTFAQGGQTLTKTFDQNYWMTDVGGSALSLHFCRDAESNITSLVPNASACTGTKTEQYVYDNLYRLTHVQDGTGSDLQDFTYNLTGDRLTKTLDPNPTQTYTYTPNTHQLDGVGANARMLDPNGNTKEITGSATLDFTFDDRNRMTAVTRNSTPITSYDFNAKGERVYKTTTYPANDTRWFDFAEAGMLLGEYTATASQEYVWADTVPVAILGTSGESLVPADRIFANGFEVPPVILSTVDYIHTDQLDSPRVVTNAGGVSQWNWPWQTNPFGETLPSGTLTLNLRFLGQYADAETGLSYNAYRDFETGTGRYIESDLAGLKGGVATYPYVESSPLRYRDTSGLFAENVHCGGCGGKPKQSINYDCFGGGGWASKISDKDLRDCVRGQCRHSRVTCSNCPKKSCKQPNGSTYSPGVPNGYDQGPGGGVTVCLNSGVQNNGDWWGAAAIHEFAHKCGWNHGDGKGVPGDPGPPGPSVPDTSNCTDAPQ
ncbi:MAG: RHS repeat-associated core domain-containing protein [Sulfuricaulis sp.]